MQAEVLSAAFADLLRLPEAARARLQVTPFAASGNNRVFAVSTGDRRYAVKVYFRHPADGRDRLHSEYAFLSCAARAGIRCVPEPVASDTRHGIGVYEHLEGRKLGAAEIDADCVEQAARFILQLNQPAMQEAARELPKASEACFSIAEHFAMVDGRIARLGGIGTADAIDREASEFIRTLAGRWQAAKHGILRDAKAAGILPDEVLEERCISPSDFGFHNALATADRGICFIDFEYAGWDDPAKLVGDFFSHPAVPVDAAHFDRFLDIVTGYSARPAALATRARILLPVFQTKWCCIILNEFLPEAAQRRRFADLGHDASARKRAQLDKAIALFKETES
jgi:hypothetical protein